LQQIGIQKYVSDIVNPVKKAISYTIYKKHHTKMSASYCQYHSSLDSTVFYGSLKA